MSNEFSRKVREIETRRIASFNGVPHEADLSEMYQAAVLEVVYGGNEDLMASTFHDFAGSKEETVREYLNRIRPIDIAKVVAA